MTRSRAIHIGAISAGASFVLTSILVWAIVHYQSQSSGAADSPAPVPGVTALHSSTPQLPAPQPSAPSRLDSANLRQTNDVLVYHAAKDAIVNITCSSMVTAQVSTGNELFDRMMPQFRRVPAQSLGSGFVIHPSGYIITNEHVVDQAIDVQCVFSSGEKLPAQVIATDAEHDLAVLKVTPPAGQPLKAIVLGASEDLMIGEPVYAIGNPYGFTGTMTRGIVSAIDRNLDVSESKSLKGLIQTDASINPGNSGGPLLNAYGQVIGVNTAIRQGAHGIGFAIAISSIRDLLPAFLNPESLNRAQTGFSVEETRTSIPPAAVSAAVRIKHVQSGSDAEKVGLQPGDQVLAINGDPVTSVVDTLVALSAAKPGDVLGLKIARRDSSTAIDLRVAVTQTPPPPTEGLLLAKMGIRAQTITPPLINRFRLPVRQGVYVDEVVRGSPAAQTRLQPGDVIVQLGRYYVTSTDDLALLLESVREPVGARIVIIRGNNRLDGTISLQ